MKILGIVCSPRPHGNTEILVQTALAKAEEQSAEIELVTLAGKNISPCDACYSCRQTGKCHIKDDMPNIYTKLSEADGIIFGTPVYYWNVTAQAKLLIDRTLVFSMNRELKDKAAGVVITMGRTGSTSALAGFNAFIALQRMVMVRYALAFGGEEKGLVKKDERGIREAEGVGEAIAKYILSQKNAA